MSWNGKPETAVSWDSELIRRDQRLVWLCEHKYVFTSVFLLAKPFKMPPKFYLWRFDLNHSVCWKSPNCMIFILLWSTVWENSECDINIQAHNYQILTGRFIAFRTAKESFLYLKTYMKKFIWKNFSTKEKFDQEIQKW